jgi:hypothetical protein
MYVLTASYLFGFSEVKQKLPGNLPKQDQCYKCHKENHGLPKDYSDNDIHRKLKCSSCHGGDPRSDDISVAMDPSNGFVGVPTKAEIPKFCGKCHSDINIMRTYQPRIATDQVAQYSTSVHGKKLLAGDKNVAECASCHTAHNILAVKDPRSTVYKFNVPSTCNKCHGDANLMKGYKLPHNQLAEYTKSVHGIALFEKKDVGAPACNDCHGNHGATPPGITSIARVCGSCHVKNMEYFETSRMAKVFEEKDFHGCEQCHTNHSVKKTSDEMLGVEAGSKCLECHKQGDSGFASAEKLKRFINNLKKNFDLATVKYEEVKQKGMNDVDIGFALQDAKQSIIQIRTLIHTFDTTKVGVQYKDGLGISNKAILLADTQIDEYYTRRNGFAVATASFMVFAVALYFIIKEKQKRNNEKNE